MQRMPTESGGSLSSSPPEQESLFILPGPPRSFLGCILELLSQKANGRRHFFGSQSHWSSTAPWGLFIQTRAFLGFVSLGGSASCWLTVCQPTPEVSNDAQSECDGQGSREVTKRAHSSHHSGWLLTSSYIWLLQNVASSPPVNLKSYTSPAQLSRTWPAFTLTSPTSL